MPRVCDAMRSSRSNRSPTPCREEAATNVTQLPAQSGDQRPAAPRPVILLVGTAGAVLVVAGLHRLAGFVGPVFLALILVVAAEPLRPLLVRRGAPRWLATVTVMVAVYLTLLLLVLSIVFSATRFASLVPSYSEDWNRMLDDGAARLSDLGIDQSQLDNVRGSLDLGKLATALGALVGSVLGIASGLTLVVMVVFFLSMDAGWFADRLAQFSGPRRPLADALSGFASGTRRYLVVSTVFGLAVAVFDWVALVWIGVPGAALWAVLAFVTNYVPNIGFVIGIVPPTLLALLEGGLPQALLVVAAYCVINFVIQSLIQPRIVGSVVGLSGTVTMLSLVFWALVLGPIGALMAVPLSLFAKAILVDADPRAQWVEQMIAPQQPEYRSRSRRTGNAPRWRRRPVKHEAS